jgi:hypothetical protein
VTAAIDRDSAADQTPGRWTRLGVWLATRSGVFFLQMAYLGVLVLFLIAYRVHWIDPRRNFFGPVPFLVPWFGAVGAVLLSFSGVFEYGGRAWSPDYRFWHWSRPFIGALAGSISVLIFQSGILAVGGDLPSQAKATTAKNLLYYIVAFVVGYRENVFRDLVKRLADVILTPAPDTAVPPKITTIEPPQVAAGAGTDVTVTGSGFTGANSVKLAGKDVSFVGESDTLLTVTIPADAEQQQTTLTVTTNQGSASTSFTIT